MWISLPILAYRRKHSDSQSEQAIPASGGRPAEIDRIMDDEENETTLLTREIDPASGGDQTPASGELQQATHLEMQPLARMKTTLSPSCTVT